MYDNKKDNNKNFRQYKLTGEYYLKSIALCQITGGAGNQPHYECEEGEKNTQDNQTTISVQRNIDNINQLSNHNIKLFESS